MLLRSLYLLRDTSIQETHKEVEMSPSSRNHSLLSVGATAIKLVHEVNLILAHNRHCATSLKVTGSIPDGVTGIFH